METHVIPWMTKEETERFVREINELARARQAKLDSAKAMVAGIQAARGGEAEHRASVMMKMGGL